MTPTAQALRAEIAATPKRALCDGLGLGTFFQLLPFQCRTSVLLPKPERLMVAPTAQTLVAEIASTACRALRAGAGLDTCFHVLPFHRSIRALDLLPQPFVQPTAQALRAETTATPLRLLFAGPGLGVRFQELPFQCRISVLGLEKLPAEPTAQAFPAERAATAARDPGTLRPEALAAGRLLATATAADDGEIIPARTPASTGATATAATERLASPDRRTGWHLPR